MCAQVSRVFFLKQNILFQKLHTKNDDMKKTGVELATMASNKHQGDSIIGENIPMLLYTTFVISVGIDF